jgi:NTP pyrophosphatase (non-canonical NTP hydrolase)
MRGRKNAVNAYVHMTMNEYQELSGRTALYPGRGSNFVYPTLGLCGEAGEVAEKVKKLMRDADAKPTDEFRENVKKELGDVLWYLAQMCHELGFTLDDVAQANIEKLRSRLERGMLHGSGDNR